MTALIGLIHTRNLSERVRIPITHSEHLRCIDPYDIGFRLSIYLFHILTVYSLIIIVLPP